MYNVARVFQHPVKATGKKLHPITIDKDTNTFTSRNNCCVHINGFIGELSPDSLQCSFKLTNTSYLTEEFSKSNWSFLFRRALETSKAIIFIGYSMYDLDIARILYADSTLRDKTIFIERDDAPEDYLENSIQNEFGTIAPVGLHGFWKEYDKVATSHIPVDRHQTVLDFSEIKISETAAPMRDDDAFDFLLKGEINIDLIWNGAIGNGLDSPFIRREEHSTVVDQIKRGERLVVVTSDMANGKSIFSIGLGCSLVAEGYQVFTLNENAIRPFEDINTITSLPGKIAVIIESYSRRFKELKYFQLRRNNELVLILTTKSVFQDGARDKLREIFGGAGIEIVLDKLCKPDIPKFSMLFSTYKLWGHNDAWPDWKKQRHIREVCARELSATLLDIVKSPEVAARFRALFAAFGKNDELSKVIITASVLKVLGYEGSRAMVAELVDACYLYSMDFNRNAEAREILNLANGKLVPRSSILARYGLSNFASTNFLIEQLIFIAKKSHELGSADKMYFDIYVSLVNYKVLQSMIPERGRRDALIRFYEATKNLRSAANHPHFWLQYALARLAYDEPEDLAKAELYLNAAYSHAKARPGYHVRHMDNVKARYLLKAGRVERDTTSAMDLFAQAHAILISQARTEHTDAPFKVASNYSNFYDSRKNELTIDQKYSIAQAAANIVLCIGHLPDDIKGEIGVRACQSNLEGIVKDIENTVSSSK